MIITARARRPTELNLDAFIQQAMDYDEGGAGSTS